LAHLHGIWHICGIWCNIYGIWHNYFWHLAQYEYLSKFWCNGIWHNRLVRDLALWHLAQSVVFAHFHGKSI
jgi:hypothetical protein